MRTASISVVFILLILSTNCGFQTETSNSTSKIIITQPLPHLTPSLVESTIDPSRTAIKNSNLSTTQSTEAASSPSHIPPTPTPIPDSWQTYSNSNLHIRFRFPGNWQAETPTNYSGSDGYFELKSQSYQASTFDTFRTACVLEANKDKPATYGAYPYITDWQGWDQDQSVSIGMGCTVTPSNGYPATQLDQAILFTRNPYLSTEDVLLVLKSDSAHFEGILSTLQFIDIPQSNPSPKSSESNTQASSPCAVTPDVSLEQTSRSNELVITEYAIVNDGCDPKIHFEDFQLRVRLLDIDKHKSIVPFATQTTNKIAYEYAKDHLFPVGSPSQVNIIRDDKIIYSLSIPQAGPAGFPVRSMWGWDKHWVLEAENVVVQDGEIQNLELGYDEMFEWHLMNGKPFYFFSKDNSFGLEYNGQILPNRYDDVIHGFLCCDYSFYSIYRSQTEVMFYALKDGVWYLVSVISGS